MNLGKKFCLLFFLFSVEVSHAAVSKEAQRQQLNLFDKESAKTHQHKGPKIPRAPIAAVSKEAQRQQLNLFDKESAKTHQHEGSKIFGTSSKENFSAEEINLRTRTTHEENREIIQSNMIALMEALQNKDIELISLISVKEISRIFLYGRERGGGNLFHYLAWNKNLDPTFIKTVFLGEDREYKTEYGYPRNKSYTAKVQVFEGLTKAVGGKVIGRVLKSRNEDGLTPKELAIQNQNKPILEFLYQIENNYNDQNDELSIVHATIGIGGALFGSIGYLAANSPMLENAAGGVALLSLASLCRSAWLQTQKINNKPSLKPKN